MIRGAAALALLLAAALPSQAQDAPGSGGTPPGAAPPESKTTLPKTLPDTLADAVGLWDISLDGTNRRCELSFSGDSGPDGRVLRFPAGCRRALPVLAGAVGWLFTGKGIRLVDRNVRPVIEFAPRPDAQSLVGTAEHGGTYSLVPLQTMAMLPANPDAPPQAGLQDTAREIPGSQPVLRADVLARPGAARGQGPEQSDTARPYRGPGGTYALDRFSDKDVCRIALESKQPTAKSDGKSEREPLKDLSPARILPGCRDGGFMVFDPVSWRYASGHLTLKARRGHAINLVPAGDGLWRRDPDTGTTLVLRKVEP